MAQTEKLQNIETGQHQRNISMSNNLPKELLQRFISGNHYNHRLNGEEGEDDDVELSLGLSLNGRFGVDPKAKKITRSSSIASDFINPTGENGSAFVVSNLESNYLPRTCSLPTETKEEWRKRKEMQTLRRMEAKRKRTEKQKILKTVTDKTMGEEDKRENGTNGDHHQKEFLKSFNGFFGVGVEGLSTQAEVAAPPLTHESQGTGSSGITEFESQPLQGMNKYTESRSPVSVQSLSDYEQRSIIAPGLVLGEKSSFPAGVAMEKNGSNKLTVTENGTKEVVRDVLEDMPYVSTKGDGPNGKHIEGFLYQYRKGEEVRIVCVCHGSFLSPAEFVKHAGGGGDVEQPLKHIVVHPSPFFLTVILMLKRQRGKGTMEVKANEVFF
ncbi:ninja-family protein AFP3 [Populus alba]|uniref:Ninja-family protein n=1 Tax=Populus alba TaxID=43335 RepID=A0A4U5Q4T0_POPAL|nr:ninja-family protein AFP3-like [Populus alba]TKS04671.1 ninja-family protein AFP3-like [Populus alba]